jgi:hypothetical protein
MLIAEIFHSVQGEGELTGVPSVFVRTSGCNLRCAWCDTPYASWQPEGKQRSLPEILREIEAHPTTRHVVLTGGEPMIAPDLPALAAGIRDLYLDLPRFQAAFAQHPAELHACLAGRAFADQGRDQPFLRRQLRLRLHVLARMVAGLGDGGLDQVAHDAVHVAADIADLGELGRLDLQEGRVGEPGEAARDLGLAAAGRADHQDVLRHHFLPQSGGKLLAPPAVPQRDRNRALGVLLADDVAVEFRDDFPGREIDRFAHASRLSRMKLPLV